MPGRLMLVVGGVLSSSLGGPLQQAIWVSSWLKNWVLPHTHSVPFRKPRQKPQCLLWSSFRSHTPFLSPYSMGYTRPSWRSLGRYSTNSWIPGESNRWGPSWRLATTFLNLLQVLKAFKKNIWGFHICLQDYEQRSRKPFVMISACITIIRGSEKLAWKLLQTSENFEKFLPTIPTSNSEVRDCLEATTGCLSCIQYQRIIH